MYNFLYHHIFFLKHVDVSSWNFSLFFLQTCKSFPSEWKTMISWSQNCTRTQTKTWWQLSVCISLQRLVCHSWWILKLDQSIVLLHVLWWPTSFEPFSCPFVIVPGLNGDWIEIAYGTSSGSVRVIVQHPETVGQGPQLFQTFTVHRSPVIKVMLSEKNLVSVCSEYNHVRTWNVTRFRGMISTQPGSTPLQSFNVVALEEQDVHPSFAAGNALG